MIKTIKKLFGIFDAHIDKLFDKLFDKWLPRKEFTRSHFPGENLKKELDKIGDKIEYVYSFIIIIVFIVCALPFVESITFKTPTMGQSLIFGVIALIIGIVAMVILMRFFFRKKIRTVKTGWLGEAVVGLALSEAGLSNWNIFHSVPKGENGGDIDHVLVCKRGIFCLETKTLFNDPQNITLKEDIVFLGKRPLPEQPIGSARTHAVWLKEKIEKEIGIRFVIPIVVFPFGKIIESSNTGKNYSASKDMEKAFAICTLEGLNELFTDFHKEKDTDFSLSEEQIKKIGKMLGELTQTTSPILH